MRTDRAPGYIRAFRLLLYGGLLGGLLWGGPVIRAAAICALPLALLGDWAGGVRQVCRLVGLTAAIFLAPRVGRVLGAWITTNLSIPASFADGGGIVVSFLAVLVGVGVIGRYVSSRLRKRRHLNACDHMLGGLVGAGEGVLLVAVVCWLLASFQTPIESIRARLAPDAPELNRHMVDALAEINAGVQQDFAGRWLTHANPLADLPAIQTAQLLVELTADPERAQSAINAGQFEKLAALPEVRQYLRAFENDPEIRAALERGDAATILRSPHVRAMFRDKELHRVLLAHRDELRAAVGRPNYARIQSAAREFDAETRREIQGLARQYDE